MSLDQTYDPAAFRMDGQRVLELLTEHLESCAERGLDVLPVISPAALLEELQAPFPARPDSSEPQSEILVAQLRRLLAHSNHLHHPGYIGHQISVPIPAAALVELTNALLSNGMAVFEMGQIQTVMERRVVEFLCSAVGYGEDSGGVLTHGGSLGNFTALLAARQAQAGHDVWTEGQREPMAVLVSEQAHYCIARSVQAMGWGAQGAWPVATDDQFRLDPSDLPRALEAAWAAGRRVIAVVGSACSTATGSFDPLIEIADFCRAHHLWFHVDGAHGASLAMSAKYKDRLSGIERADSVVWDLHKMLGLPALNTAVLFREERRSYEAFAQEASYLFESTSPEEQWFNLGQRTMECTKRGMAVTAYCMFQLLGTAWFGEHIDRLMELTCVLEGMIEAAEDFEIACPGQANILCFRHRPRGVGDGRELDNHQARLRRELVESGEFYIVQARLRGEAWLRVTMMNPMTTREDLGRLLGSLRRLANG